MYNFVRQRYVGYKLRERYYSNVLIFFIIRYFKENIRYPV